MEKSPILSLRLPFYYIIGVAEESEKDIAIFISKRACEAQCVAIRWKILLARCWYFPGRDFVIFALLLILRAFGEACDLSILQKNT